MPITKIIIENFKGIRDRVEIPIRPITLLFGANSAGKSTILHALLYLRELLERQNADADRVIGGGSDVFLGGFRQLVHGHDETKTVKVGVEFSVDADGLEPYPISRVLTDWTSSGEVPDPVWINGVSGVESVRIEVSIAVSAITGRPQISEYSVAINGEKIGTISANREIRAILCEIAVEHPIFAAQYSPDAFDPEFPNPITASLQGTFEGAQFLGPVAIREGWIALGHQVIPKWGEPLDFDIDESAEEGDAINAPFAKFILSQLMVRPGQLILEHLRTYRHLGPIRAVPDLRFIGQRTPDPDRWIDGMAAWDHLYRDAKDKADLIKIVDQYLSREDRLDLGYSLTAETIINLPIDAPIMNLLERYAIAPDDFEESDQFRIALDDLMSRDMSGKLVLTDIRRSTTVNPSDIGAGVAQVIPVLVSVLESSSKITAIEQPELHLHPAVQCNLGDLFVRAANKADERFFIIESHSEHLLLRLMKRMRQTQADEIPDQDLQLRPESIVILFVETFEGRSVYREMPLNEKGELVKAWPGGFFEEDLEEIF